jgi:hypothetical protein
VFLKESMKMKRAVFFIITFVSSVLVSQASVSFQWRNTTVGSSTYWYNYPTAPAAYSNTPAQFTVLTYMSSDTTVDFDTSRALSGSYGSGVGQDTFVYATNTTGIGRYTTPIMNLGAAGTGAGSYVGSYAYMVLVAMPISTFASFGSLGAIPAGTLIGVSVMSSTALTQYDVAGPAPTPQQFNVGNVVADIALVPEPSSFALLGIGLGLVGLRRFRRK